VERGGSVLDGAGAGVVWAGGVCAGVVWAGGGELGGAVGAAAVLGEVALGAVGAWLPAPCGLAPGCSGPWKRA
jgi:hypothetical protein